MSTHSHGFEFKYIAIYVRIAVILMNKIYKSFVVVINAHTFVRRQFTPFCCQSRCNNICIALDWMKWIHHNFFFWSRCIFVTPRLYVVFDRVRWTISTYPTGKDWLLRLWWIFIHEIQNGIIFISVSFWFNSRMKEFIWLNLYRKKGERNKKKIEEELRESIKKIWNRWSNVQFMKVPLDISLK